MQIMHFEIFLAYQGIAYRNITKSISIQWLTSFLPYTLTFFFTLKYLSTLFYGFLNIVLLLNFNLIKSILDALQQNMDQVAKVCFEICGQMGADLKSKFFFQCFKIQIVIFIWIQYKNMHSN